MRTEVSNHMSLRVTAWFSLSLNPQPRAYFPAISIYESSDVVSRSQWIPYPEKPVPDLRTLSNHVTIFYL